MARAGCEERRRKLKAMYDNSRESIANAIARIANRNRKAERYGISAEQSADSSTSGTNPAEQRVATAARSRARRTKST